MKHFNDETLKSSKSESIFLVSSSYDARSLHENNMHTLYSNRITFIWDVHFYNEIHELKIFFRPAYIKATIEKQRAERLTIKS